MKQDYKEHLKNNTFHHIRVIDTQGYVIRTFTDKTELSSYIVKQGLIPIEWDCVFVENIGQIIISVYVL
tara:strand:- start:3 stop:209 length:207 start_codon:yes stop_codon:yes gene_type:complete